MKKSNPAILLAMMVALTLSACASVGNGKVTQLDQSQAAASLTPGKTTKADVSELLGDAKIITFSNGDTNEIWLYQFDQNFSKALLYMPYVSLFVHAQDFKGKEFALLFDKDGVLKKYRFNGG
jgi:outer membrane protein assembly factor BamE (lipoprotein component of BamABCDE complex)